MFFAGCDLLAGGPASPTVYEPLIVRVVGIYGENVEVEISTTRTGQRAVLTPESGDSYVLRVDGEVRSTGTIEIDGTQIVFHPYNGAMPFTGSYDRVEGFIILYEIPAYDGTVDPLPGAPTGPGAYIPPEVYYNVDNEAQLNSAIGKIRTELVLKKGQKAVIRLTEVFYAAANTAGTYITVDAGPTANTVPYTIRGLGKNTGNPNKKLTVGMWLANNNVTLEEVEFEFIVNANGIMPVRPWNTAGTLKYGVGIFIARSTDGENSSGSSSSVTVQECTVKVTGSAAGANFTGGIWVYGSSSDTKILGNTVTVTGNSSSAVQALAFERWGNNIKVINNNLTAKYQTRPAASGQSTIDAPASALYFGRAVEGNFTGWEIKGNTLSYDWNTNSCYSFYVAALAEPVSYAGVADMRSTYFGRTDSTWALRTSPATAFHKRLLDALLSNISGTTGNGFGTFLLVLYEPPGGGQPDIVFEIYTITDGKIAHIAMCGYSSISNDKFADGSWNYYFADQVITWNGSAYIRDPAPSSYGTSNGVFRNHYP